MGARRMATNPFVPTAVATRRSPWLDGSPPPPARALLRIVAPLAVGPSVLERHVGDEPPDRTHRPSQIRLRAAMTEEEKLLSRAVAGDREAFREIFVMRRGEVLRVCFRMLGPRSDLDDVVQEVFFQVFRSLRDFRGQAKFTTWLHRVTVNVVLMHRRAERSRPVYAEEAPPDLTGDNDAELPDDEAERRERMRAFSRLVERLAEKKRVVFVLHELEGMSPQEISTIVGAPVLTVRTRLFYARRELEAMMHEEPALVDVSRERRVARGRRDAARSVEPVEPALGAEPVSRREAE